MLRHVEARTLIILIAVTGGIWGFVELADEVVEGQTQSFDERILRFEGGATGSTPDAKEALARFLSGLPPGKRTELLLPLNIGIARRHGTNGE